MSSTLHAPLPLCVGMSMSSTLHATPSSSTDPPTYRPYISIKRSPLTLKPGHITSIKTHLKTKLQFEHHLSVVKEDLASLSDLVLVAEKRSELLRKSADGFVHWWQKQQIQKEKDKLLSPSRRGLKEIFCRIVRVIQVAKTEAVIAKIDFSKYKSLTSPSRKSPSWNMSPTRSPKMSFKKNLGLNSEII